MCGAAALAGPGLRAGYAGRDPRTPRRGDGAGEEPDGTAPGARGSDRALLWRLFGCPLGACWDLHAASGTITSLQIFLDMAVLVEAQGEMLDNIEAQVRQLCGTGGGAYRGSRALQQHASFDSSSSSSSSSSSR